ncbi:MAG: hypothetical protein WCQ64_02100 [Acidobacteriota bacterium]
MNILLNCLPESSDGAFDSLFTPLLDRPFLQGVVEHLVQSGARTIDVIAATDDRRVRALLGDGTRWGCELRVHHTDASLLVAMRDIITRFEMHGPVLMASGHTLPLVDLSAGTPPPLQRAPTVYVDAARRAWTGWAWLPRDGAATLARLASTASLAKRLLARAGVSDAIVRVPHVLAVGSAADLLEAHRAVLTAVCPTWQRAAREVSPGVWVSRNANLDPATHVVAPVFIGAGAHVSAGTFGPYAVAAERCVVDHAAGVSNATVMARTYLGPSLTLMDAVASGRTLYSVRHRAAVEVGDWTFMHALTDEGANRWLDRWFTRLRAQPAGGASQTAPVPAD